MSDIPFQEIERRWQERWARERVFEPQESDPRDRFYCIEMLPYPSGRIHMGHVRNYTIGDALAWFRRMQGYNVLHPMGWDSLGLPAENAAIQRGADPREWTLANIEAMKAQLRRLGFSYAWEREVTTCEPEYYRWNQWFFLKMLERGLAYRGRRILNWCPLCATVLANEQVVDGFCWRHDDTLVEPREMDQWFVRITDYADELARALDDMPGWPDRVVTMQRNWIGRSVGCRVRFAVEDEADPIEVFTTRVDTVYGATALVLAPEHPRLAGIARAGGREAEVSRFVAEDRARRLADRFTATVDKLGVFTGRHAINPFSGEKIPIWCANFVLMEYGSGALMAVPAHDVRDHEFATKYGIPVRTVVLPSEGAVAETPFTGDGVLTESGSWSGAPSARARADMAERAKAGGFGEASIQFRLKDWGISRQRYWGTPIPVIYCDGCGTVPVPEKDLPVVLPHVDLRGATGSPLASVPEFVNVACPRCGGKGRRETDTMDTFVDSSWYFYRYTDPKNASTPFARERAEAWFPIDLYIGGIEHATGHLIYCRFFTKFMRDLGLLAHDEPVTNLLTQGMVISYSSFCEEHRWLYPDQVREDRSASDSAAAADARATYHCLQCGRPVARTLEKMSKSKNNIVDPDAAVERYGADAIRIFALFASPPDAEVLWTEQGMEGAHRFLGRLWRFVDKHGSKLGDGAAGGDRGADAAALALRRRTHRTIQRVTDDIARRLQFNTAVAALMELLNAIYEFNDRESLSAEEATAVREALRTLVALLAPFAPHVCEELWERLGGEGLLAQGTWPTADPALLVEDTSLIVVQVNGKLRARIPVPRGASQDDVLSAARGDERVAAAVGQATIRKVVHVPERLLNLVTG